MTERQVDVERVYDHPSAESGFRVFVDRLWPRGMRKDSFHYDDWAKDLAPSTELRRWYGHDRAEFAEFRSRYLTELESADARSAVEQVLDLAEDRPIILLTATRDTEHSHVEVLRDFLRQT